jgi:tetratricopeptide (TPR) repeat protein
MNISEKKIHFLQIIIIFFLAVAVYFSSFFNGFVYDDLFQVVENPWIRDVNFVPDIFLHHAWQYREGLGSNYYRPMMHIFYMVIYHLFGPVPWAYHSLNVLFHAGVSVLVFLIAGRLIRGNDNGHSLFSVPLVAGVIFAVQPIHTEAVAWVSALPELSFSFFFLLSLYLHTKALWDQSLRRIPHIFSLASFVISLLCKESALTLPLVLVALDYVLHGSRFFQSKRYLLAVLGPYLMSTVLYLAMRKFVLGQVVPVDRGEGLYGYQYFLNAFPLLLQYLEKLVLPINLNAFYSFHPLRSALEVRSLLSIAFVIVFAVIFFVVVKKNKAVFFGLFFIIATLLPALYIPALAVNTFAERYLYLPSIGFAMLASLMFSHSFRQKAKSSVLVTAILLLTVAFYSVGTIGRIPVWKDDYSLWADTVKKSPDSPLVHNNLGYSLAEKGRFDEAIYHYLAALRFDPRHAEARNNLGVALFNKDRVDEAIEQFKIAISLRPAYREAHYNLGIAYEEMTMGMEGRPFP